MRISGSGSAVAAGARHEAGRGSFPVPSFAPAAGSAGGRGAIIGAGSGLALASLEALVALQALPDALERRRRGVRRGERLLDGLEALHLAFLDGAVPTATLTGLRSELAAAREASDDPALEA